VEIYQSSISKIKCSWIFRYLDPQICLVSEVDLTDNHCTQISSWKWRYCI